VRVLFTVALAVAVLGVVTPEIQAVGVERADTKTGAAVERLVEAARSLAAGNDALAPARGPARRVVDLDLPSGGVASTPLRSLTVGPPAAGGDHAEGEDTTAATQVTWRVAGGRRHVRQVAGLGVRPASGERFELARGGHQRLVLRLVTRRGRRIVTIATPG